MILSDLKIDNEYLEIYDRIKKDFGDDVSLIDIYDDGDRTILFFLKTPVEAIVVECFLSGQWYDIKERASAPIP